VEDRITCAIIEHVEFCPRCYQGSMSVLKILSAEVYQQSFIYVKFVNYQRLIIYLQ